MHWTGVTEQLIAQKIPGCTETCPLEKFLQLTKDVIPDDNEYECSASDKESERRNKLFYEGQGVAFSSSDSVKLVLGCWQMSFTIAIVYLFNKMHS